MPLEFIRPGARVTVPEIDGEVPMVERKLLCVCFGEHPSDPEEILVTYTLDHLEDLPADMVKAIDSSDRRYVFTEQYGDPIWD